MMPVIRIDDEAIKLGFVFKSPNDVLRANLNLEGNPAVIPGRTASSTFDSVEVRLNKSSPKCNLIPVRRKHRSFFPGYQDDFDLDTDAGTVTTHVTSDKKGKAKGAPRAGDYIMAGLGPWYKKHVELAEGSKVYIEAVEPGKRYKLTIAVSN